MKFKVGDRVVKNPMTWIANDFDDWGRGIGVGEIVEIDLSDRSDVDVRWPAGRCYEQPGGLMKVKPT
jgi:hypothetical protein